MDDLDAGLDLKGNKYTYILFWFSFEEEPLQQCKKLAF